MTRGRRSPERGSPAAADRWHRLMGPAVFVVALIVRLLQLLDSASSPTFSLPLIDAGSYHQRALDLAQGYGMSAETFWQPIFYPLFLGLVYKLAGASIVVAKVIQAALGALTCYLIFRLGRELFDRRIGLAAGLVTGVSGPLVFFESELLATGWAAFWTVALLLIFLGLRRRPALLECFVAGVCGALSTLTRPTFLPFFVAGAVWLAISLRRDGASSRRLAPRLALLGLGFALLATPVALVNRHYTGSASFLPTSGGLNLFLGNNPRREEALLIRPGNRWQQLTGLPSLCRPGSPPGAIFYERVLRYARTSPGELLGGLGVKGAQFFSAREIPRNEDLYGARQSSALLAALVWKAGGWGFPAGVLLPLALLGLVLGWRRLPGPVRLLALIYPASVIAVFVCSRYRAPLIPLLSLLAVVGVAQGLRVAREGSWSRRAAVLVLVVTGVLVTTLPGPWPEEAIDYGAERDYLIGTTLAKRGELAAARRHLARAVERRPGYASAHHNLGSTLFRLGQVQQSVPHYRAAIRHDPEYALSQTYIARSLQALGRAAEARRHRERAQQLVRARRRRCRSGF